MNKPLQEARAQAEKMQAHQLAHGRDAAYEEMQREMQRILRRLDELDASGCYTPFDYMVWLHSAKPPRRIRNLFRM